MATVTILTRNSSSSLFPQNYIPDSMVWDPRPNHPFIYLMCPANYPKAHYMLKFNRETMAMVLQVSETHDTWSSFGVPDIDLQGRLYWDWPGGLTFGAQKLGRFSGDTLLGIDSAIEEGIQARRVSGTFRVDRRSIYGFWWHREDSDLNHGRISCFRQSDMQHVYDVPRTAFEIGVGPGSGPRNVKDMEPDADGVLWEIQDWPKRPGGSEVRLFKTLPTGETSIVSDISLIAQNLFGGPGSDIPHVESLKWVAQDNSLVTYIPPYLIKMSCPSGEVIGTLGTGAGLGGQGLHHTNDDTHPFIWIGNTYIDTTIPTPNGSHRFPQFVEIDLINLVVARTIQTPEVGAFYPFVNYLSPPDVAANANPRACLWDPSTNCLITDNVATFTACHYCFDGETGGGGGGVQLVPPMCPPVGVTLSTTHAKFVLFPANLL